MNKYCLVLTFFVSSSLMAMQSGGRMLYAPGTQPKTGVERLCIATAGSCIGGVVATCGFCQGNPLCLYTGLGVMGVSQIGGGLSFFLCKAQKKEQHREESEFAYHQRLTTHFLSDIQQIRSEQRDSVRQNRAFQAFPEIRSLPRACLQQNSAYQEPFMTLPGAVPHR